MVLKYKELKGKIKVGDRVKFEDMPAMFYISSVNIGTIFEILNDGFRVYAPTLEWCRFLYLKFDSKGSLDLIDYEGECECDLEVNKRDNWPCHNCITKPIDTKSIVCIHSEEDVYNKPKDTMKCGQSVDEFFDEVESAKKHFNKPKDLTMLEVGDRVTDNHVVREVLSVLEGVGWKTVYVITNDAARETCCVVTAGYLKTSDYTIVDKEKSHYFGCKSIERFDCDCGIVDKEPEVKKSEDCTKCSCGQIDVPEHGVMTYGIGK